MKHLAGLLIFLSFGFQLSAQGYRINLQSNYRQGIAYLTYYRGKDFLVQDSAAVSNTGLAVFKGPQKLPGGIYSIVFPGKRLTTDLLIDKEQIISIKADTNNLDNVAITGAPANELFKKYKAFVNVKGEQLQTEKIAYASAKNKTDSALHLAAYSKYSKELNDFRDNIIRTKPESMMAVLLNAMKDPAIPTKRPVTHADSLENYNYFKDHYWDGITFMDERVIRTPFFLPKLETYYREVMSQSSDSLIRDITYKLLLARNSPEMFKYLLNWYTDEYIRPKYMGQDAVFVYLFNAYHSQGLSKWLNEKQMKTVTERAYMLMANLVGEKAANLEFLNAADVASPLYDVNSEYTVLLFWDPSCGHCKEELPKIDSIYRAVWKARGIKIYAVLTEDDKVAWLSFLKDHHLEEWINVYQTKAMAEAEKKSDKPGFRQLFDVTQTPTIYLLDREKRIVGKKLTWEQINDLLDAKARVKS